MRNKKIFIPILLFMVVLSIGAISAQDVDDAIASNSENDILGTSGSVSGGVDVETENPWATSGALNYTIPDDATIKSADVYVNVYGGSAQNTYGANANITITTEKNETKYYESLWTADGSTDGTVYTVNDHTTKCYSDYMIHYDVTSMLDGLKGDFKINVDTFQMENKSFDGRIKLIALVLAYDDSDGDSISYWINDDQLWTKTSATVTFDTGSVDKIFDANLCNIVLSSGDGTYMINGEILGDATVHESGDYYQYNEWNVNDVVKANKKTDLTVMYAGTSSYGSIKNVLSVLTISNNLITDVSITPEYTSVPSVYAGTNNTLTIKVKTTKAGKYAINLYADDSKVNGTEIDLAEGENTILLTDPTVRPLDETTVNGAENKMVKYTVDILSDDSTVYSKEASFPVLYNGNLGYDMEYDMNGFTEYVAHITGDIVIDVKDVSSYLSASAMNRTDVWAVNLTENSELVGATLIIPYNWFNARDYNETIDMFNLTFNGETINAYGFYRDQGNLGNYGKYGYGYLEYDVTNLLNTKGDNTLILNKVNPTPAVYPSVLFYLYNTEGGSIKEIDYLAGVDLLANTNNKAGRPVKSDIMIGLDKEEYKSVKLYALAASAQAGEGNLIINGNEIADIWTGTSSTTDLFTTDITDMITQEFNITFVATGSTILALPQFIVADYGYGFTIDSIQTEYTSVPTCYAGTNNTLTVTINTNTAGEFEIELWADDQQVDTVTVNLTEGRNTVLLTDPTIRPVDETTVNGADNDKVTYLVGVSFNDLTSEKDITVPVLYNGNLGYNMEYNITGFENIAPITFNGDIVIDIKDVSSYLGASAMNRTDVWTVDLDDNSEITTAFIYVPYNWFNAKAYTEDSIMFNVTFNGASVTPIAWYRDQGNLGNYGQYGYGIFVYDVSDLIETGDNSLVLNKVNPTPAVYPSALVYMYDTEGSTAYKTAYILNGADLLSNANNVAKRTAKADTEITVDTDDIDNAVLYVFAASAQTGESNIVFNGNVYENVWNGTSSTTDLFTADVTGLINDTNSISFVATGSTILELPQIIVTSNTKTKTALITPTRVISVANGIIGYDYQFILKDENGNALAGKEVSVIFNGETQTVTTDEKGWGTATVKAGAEGTYEVTVSFEGDSEYSEISQTATIKLVKEKTQFIAPDRVVYVQQMSRGYTYSAILKDQNGNTLANKKVLFKFNGESIVTYTDENGWATVKLTAVNAGEQTVTIKFAGTASCYYETSITKTIKIVREQSKLSVPDKTFPVSGEKKVTATLKSKSDNPVYGAKVTLTVNGRTYTATTDNSGIATFSIDINNLGTFSATTKFDDSRFFAATSVTSKIYII